MMPSIGECLYGEHDETEGTLTEARGFLIVDGNGDHLCIVPGADDTYSENSPGAATARRIATALACTTDTAGPRLYYILHTDDDGDNFDLYVYATNPAEAVKLWREHYDSHRHAAGIESFNPTRVDEVPTPTTIGAVGWQNVVSVDWEDISESAYVLVIGSQDQTFVGPFPNLAAATAYADRKRASDPQFEFSPMTEADMRANIAEHGDIARQSPEEGQ